jgi:hypothetical protein
LLCALVDQEDESVDALRLQFRDHSIDGIGLVHEMQRFDARGIDDGGGGLQHCADER